MSGGAEATALLSRELPAGSRIEAYDFCEAMCHLARENFLRKNLSNVSIEARDVFSIPAAPRFDRIVCTFGIKTLSDTQLQSFAKLIGQWLRPGGVASFVEIHIPSNHLIRWPFLFYVRRVIPLLGRLAQRNADCYRWLSVFTEDFAGRDRFVRQLQDAGLKCSQKALFFGCARLYVASKF
jgi:demethylmenaquinone methyltransferase/2-methoxy-6-polyprenyl-1,4-benzoquinol methylase